MRELRPLLTRYPSLHVAVNVAACDITSGQILKLVEQSLRGSNIHPSQIWLEATERGLLEASARETIVQARQAGHPVAIDDFGTGVRWLILLAGIPVRRLENRQVLYRHHRHRLGHQQRNPAHHQHGAGAAPGSWLPRASRRRHKPISWRTVASITPRAGSIRRPLTASAFIAYCMANVAARADSSPPAPRTKTASRSRAQRPPPPQRCRASVSKGLALVPAGA